MDLGGAEVPSGVGGDTAEEIETAVKQSFLSAFRLAMYISAGSALASAAAAAIIIEGKYRPAPVQEADGRPEETAEETAA